MSSKVKDLGAGGAARQEASPASLERSFVLLVHGRNDDPCGFDEVGAALGELYDLEICGDSEEALSRIVAGARPNLIIARQRMAGLSGVELLRAAAKIYPQCVGFILSEIGQRAELLGVINQGPVVGSLCKPWHLDELKQSVEQAIRIGQQRSVAVDEGGQLNQLRAEIRRCKVAARDLVEQGVELHDPQVQKLRRQMLRSRQRLAELTAVNRPAAVAVSPELSEPAVALEAPVLKGS